MAKHKSVNSHERSQRSYDRPFGKRIPNETILIICEGKETEPNYFESLRKFLKLSTINVKIIESAGAPISIVNKAIDILQKQKKMHQNFEKKCSKINSVWCVFDVENPSLNPTLAPAVKIADDSKFRLIISNPAFEFWYLLHFERTTRPFADGNEIKDYLRKRCIPNYHTSMDVFQLLYSSTRDAINNAKSIPCQPGEIQNRFPNPSTSVYRLVEEMIKMNPIEGHYFE